MKKRIIPIVLCLCLLCGMVISVNAEELPSRTGWYAKFTAEGKMIDNFGSKSSTESLTNLNDPIRDMQPGDEVTFYIDLSNEHQYSTDWYMTNEVLDSLEDGKRASGGAYTYILTFNGPSGEKELYNSDTVGGDEGTGDGRQGLHEATEGLENYIFLDTLAKGQTANVKLHVLLDGETQGNAYQDTWADLQMNFAVELRTPTPPSTTPDRPTIVRTGDDTNVLPLLLVMGISGLLLLALGIYGVKNRKRERGGV